MDISCHARDVDSTLTPSRNQQDNHVRPRVLLAHPQPVVLEGLRLIAERAGFQVSAVAEVGSAIILAGESLNPDLIVVESGMDESAGRDVALAIRRRNPQVAVLFLGTPEEERLRDALSSGPGFSRFVSKSASVNELRHAMRLTFERRVLPHSAEQASSQPSHGQARLTPRQLEVLRLVAEGKTAKQVASVLNISARTAEFHKLRVMETLKLRSTAELTRYAIEHNVCEARLPARGVGRFAA